MSFVINSIRDRHSQLQGSTEERQTGGQDFLTLHVTISSRNLLSVNVCIEMIE